MLQKDVCFYLDGMRLTAHAGQTVAAALLLAGKQTLRWTGRRGAPRGLFCGMGVCQECQVCINGRPGMRACQVEVQEGMRVQVQRGAGTWDHGV
ncbi:MAG: (2Fe-2S)-binding protein [Planctomycetes bacterium]|nr:(2Fe-2S)-binding protein [Planctomycetota bacterium]